MTSQALRCGRRQLTLSREVCSPTLPVPPVRAVAEHIPRYVRIALRLMYESQLGRSAVLLSGVKTALRRISAREGCVRVCRRCSFRLWE